MQVSVAADLTKIAAFARTLDKESATVVRWRVRRAVTDVGAKVMADAKANAAWSTGHTSREPKRTRQADAVGDVHSSIPSAISLRTSFAARSARVTLKTDRKKAPHAYLWERGSIHGGGAVLRHKVFGNEEVWRQSPTRPFFFKAAFGNRDEFGHRLQQELDAAMHELGFHA